MIAAFDLDGTLLKKNSSFSFCRFLCTQGVLSRLDYLFCLYTYCRHLYGSLSLCDLHRLSFERLFRGKRVATLQQYVEPFLDKTLEKLWYRPALLRLRALQQQGVECLILSSSPRFLVAQIGQRIGVATVYATEYLLNQQGELSGIASLMDGEKKGSLLKQFSYTTTWAFSDSHVDISFLRAAHVAVAVNPKRKLKLIAEQEGWEIL